MSASLPETSLRGIYEAGTAAIRQRFETTGDGRTAVLERTALVEEIVLQFHKQLFSADVHGPEDFCLAAIGGYGRRLLFPYSDVDLLFLSADDRAAADEREAVAAVQRFLWDLGVRVSPAVRTLAECNKMDPENLEFPVALLDARYLAGDARLFARLREHDLPQLFAREHSGLVRTLTELTRRRHARHGDTIFHLEPNIKEAPGGLRDYQLASWLMLLTELEKHRRWVTPEGLWPVALERECSEAFAFLSAVRCFLHYHRGRDDNQLTYELQAEAAFSVIGQRRGQEPVPEEWMRTYFQHARAIHRLAAQLLDEASAARPSLYDTFQDWRSRLSNADFAVVRGRIFPRQPAALADPDELLGLFEFIARHGLELSREAERAVGEAFPRLGAAGLRWPGLWPHLRRLLILPHAAQALRAMHRLGLLAHLFPEFGAIDSLVIRDYYHRYTVDEHTFLAIQSLHRLRRPENQWEEKFAEIFSELEQPELLFLSLLFHDVGKGMPVENHIQGSLEALEAVSSRLVFEPRERETVAFLVANHLLMSATVLRRDIFDPGTVHNFAEAVGAAERLKMLSLFTYADIRAVGPDTLTPWKAEMLWQLYAATANYLSRSLDDARFHAVSDEAARVERVRTRLAYPAESEKLSAFLEGFPRRYLSMRSPEEIAAHFAMAMRLSGDSAELSLQARGHSWELAVITRDRPFLFTLLTGTLAAWGMNIVKADAFANAAGIVLDTFYFTDPFRTLELNPSEVERFQKSLLDVLSGRARLDRLLSGRVNPQSAPPAKVKVLTEIRFDDASAANSTLLELITQDRPGLLYQVSAAIAAVGCNIEVALIDTEGQKAIDIFYLTFQGARLDPRCQQALREALLERL